VCALRRLLANNKLPGRILQVTGLAMIQYVHEAFRGTTSRGLS